MQRAKKSGMTISCIEAKGWQYMVYKRKRSWYITTYSRGESLLPIFTIDAQMRKKWRISVIIRPAATATFAAVASEAWRIAQQTHYGPTVIYLSELFFSLYGSEVYIVVECELCCESRAAAQPSLSRLQRHRARDCVIISPVLSETLPRASRSVHRCRWTPTGLDVYHAYIVYLHTYYVIRINEALLNNVYIYRIFENERVQTASITFIRISCKSR